MDSTKHQYNAAQERIRAVANEILAEKLGIIEGSQLLLPLKHTVTIDDFDPDFVTFVAVDSETDHLPVGEDRRHWATAALANKDREIQEADACYKEQVIEACKRLLAQFVKWTICITRWF